MGSEVEALVSGMPSDWLWMSTIASLLLMFISINYSSMAECIYIF